MHALSLLLAVPFIQQALAATADQWRGRSIYQIIVDRYALPPGAHPNACNVADQTWCGGTWKSITANLDYIQKAGFTAIWISPISQNYVGPRTAYGDPYHGYWIQDASQLNAKFGTADDLKGLSAALHQRGMYLMVDVVVNDVMATSTTPDYSPYMFKDASQYHTYCPIDFSNQTSVEQCWLGDTNVSLPDLRTEDPQIQATYQKWIKDMVQEYSIDGLRIDAAKHVDIDFWPPFCAAAGVFCIGEVFEADVGKAAVYQGSGSLDSILNYPMYNALVEAFTIPGPNNISAIADILSQEQSKFGDPGLLGNFLENQDVPRWANMSVDPQSMYNAMTFNFMSDGIPIIYYGQEQGFHGASDPYNREAMWPSNYDTTGPAYKLVQTLNHVRNWLVNTTDWVHSTTQLLTTTPNGFAIMKGQVLTVLTTVGSPPLNVSIPVYTPFQRNQAMTEILTCAQYVVGSNGTIAVAYSKGGVPSIMMPTESLTGSGLCGTTAAGTKGGTGATSHSAGSRVSLEWSAGLLSAVGVLLSALALVF